MCHPSRLSGAIGPATTSCGLLGAATSASRVFSAPAACYADSERFARGHELLTEPLVSGVRCGWQTTAVIKCRRTTRDHVKWPKIAWPDCTGQTGHSVTAPPRPHQNKLPGCYPRATLPPGEPGTRRENGTPHGNRMR